MPEPRFAVGELADLGGVSRRTVRYYVQEGLLPAPFGIGRGDHYGPAHLERIRQVKAFQEQGLSLDEIRVRLAAPGGDRLAAAAMRADAPPSPPAATVWRRVRLTPGVELHVSGDVRQPGPDALRALSEWCRQHLGVVGTAEE